MKKEKIMVSIVITHYKTVEELYNCIDSIYKSGVKALFEIIVVDNDEKKYIKKTLKNKFPKIAYVPTVKNRGYGAGNNLGAKNAKGEYIFFLNPDTLFVNNVIDDLLDFIKSQKNVGAVSPLFETKDGVVYQQGSRTLGFLEGIFAISFINRLFPNNPISKRYYVRLGNKKRNQQVDVVPGTALMIKKDVFEQAGGFDEKFFLYFEEFDLCKRLKEKNLINYIIKKGKVIHLFAQSIKKSRFDTLNIFKTSRFYYFRKHEGLFKAYIVEGVNRFNKTTALLSLTLIIGAAVRFYNIADQMVFIGDQGWFYLSARDIILKNQIPLVGITSSHSWLHQGPLWTYLLTIPFWISRFNPVSPVYISILFDIATICMIYVLGSRLFGKTVGLLSSAFYATSPLVIFYSRMPYHTTPMPFFTLLFIFFLEKWTRGEYSVLPLIFLTLGLLYNFELFSVVLFFVLIVFVLLKIRNSQPVFNLKLISKSLLFLFLPLLPVILYDFSHGFVQTIVFLGWIIYKPFSLVLHPSFVSKSTDLLVFLSLYLKRFLFPMSGPVCFIVFTASIFLLLIQSIKKRKSYLLLLLTVVILLAALLANAVPSEAYLFLFFPVMAIVIGLLFEQLLRFSKLSLILIMLLLFFNVYYLLSGNYSLGYYKTTFKDRLNAAKKIVYLSQGQAYTLRGLGAGSEFENYTKNYEYLAWWLGNGPSPGAQKVIIVEEKNSKIFVSTK